MAPRIFISLPLATPWAQGATATDVIGYPGRRPEGFFAQHIELNEGTNDAVEKKPSFITVAFPNAKATYPFGLIEKRIVNGTHVDSNGGIHGFVATPNF